MKGKLARLVLIVLVTALVSAASGADVPGAAIDPALGPALEDLPLGPSIAPPQAPEPIAVCAPSPGPGCFQCCYAELKTCNAGCSTTECLAECSQAYQACRNDCIP